ncbi:MAG: tRNA pseudouridine(38-40) synthase TruA, partial [Sulfurovum sp.]|nr:tRNA pseudouridine(38-40) synthase TruA [Sulfurovaceae bacterium]
MNVKAVISYDGGFFSGFQKQNSTQQTVTTQIENALKSLNISSKIIGSGRTDAGVHATGQVINFTLPYYWSDLYRLKEALNRKLHHIFIKRISEVDIE